MVDTERLNSEIRKAGLVKKHIAADLQITRQSLFNKIKGRTGFKHEEMFYLQSALDLSYDDMMNIFFYGGCGK